MPPTDAGQPLAPPGGPTPPPPPTAGGSARLQIQWDDLNTRRVDQRLKEQAALERNRRQAAMDPLSATTSALAAEDAAAGQPGPGAGHARFVLHPAVALALFGLLGGLLAWASGEAVLRAQPDPKVEAGTAMQAVANYQARRLQGMPAETVTRGIESLKAAYADNPYFAVMVDDKLTDDARTAKLAEVDASQRPRRVMADLLSFGLSGLLIAAALAAAEPLMAGRRSAAVGHALVGAAVGLVGGAVVSLFVQQLFARIVAAVPPAAAGHVDWARLAARSASWAVLGLFVTVGPGLVARNGKKLAIGLLGGLVGGAIGGAAFDAIGTAANGSVANAVALCLIGVVAGALVGLIEHAAKTGWLKVTAGLIAGKQFILYRNPTFIGSGPECPIYLFKDPQVGRRHAAVHVVADGFELENLPLGAATLVNGRPITRARLRNGDEVQVGGTRFRFQEKVKAQ